MHFFISLPVITRRVILYALIGGAAFIAVNMLGWFAFLTYKNHMHPTLSVSADPAGLLIEKTAYYLSHKDDYTALFLGDSRTLCGMHPDFVDPAWGRRSYNLSHWATWMSSQYSLIADIVDDIPTDTVVVWSIGHQNFRSFNEIRAVYPPGWVHGFELARFGYPPGALFMAQMAFTPPAVLVGRSREFFDRVITLFEKPLYSSAAASAPSSPDASLSREASEITSIAARPLTSYTEEWRDDQGRLASIAQYKTNGAMARIEIRPDFYRSKQVNAPGAGYDFTTHAADEPSMKALRASLELFRAHGVRLIVNELEESPYRYGSAAQRDQFRRWMRTHIKPIVEEYGFTYIHTDEANLRDADYFDYNHLNEKGARKQNAVLARKLKAIAP